jgi:hypothetical protein
MRKHVTKLALMAFLALLLVALPLISACGGDDDEENGAEEKKQVAIGVLFDISGVSAAIMGRLFEAWGDAFKYANEVEGGIDGAEIVMRWVDTQWQVSKSISGFKRIMAQKPKPVIVATQTGQETEVLLDLAEEEQVPLLAFTLFKSSISPPQWAWGMMAPQADSFAALADYIMENWTEARAPKLAHMSPDNAWGRSNFGAFPYAEDKGIEIHTEFMSQTSIDTTAQLMRIRDWGADFIFVQAIETQATMVLKDAERLGLTGEVQFVLPPHATPYDVMPLVGEASDGVWSISIGLLGPDAEGLPGRELQRRIAEYAVGEGKFDYADAKHGSVYPYPYMLVELLRAVAAEVGGIENVDGAAVYNFMANRVWEFDPGGLQLPFHWEPGKRLLTSSFVLYEMRGGELHRLTDLIKPPQIIEP